MPRTFVIAGASKGIGLATAKLLAGDGHTVIGLARTAPEAFPGTFLACDLADRNATQAVVDDIQSRFTVDGVVNNVGLVRPALLGEVTLDDLDAVMDLNLRAALQVTQPFIAGMRKSRPAR